MSDMSPPHTPTETDADGPGDPPPASASAAAPRRLERHPTDKVVGGVAAGLARYFGVDPIVFRLAFVAFALFGGGGVLLYLIAWVAMPPGGEGGEDVRRPPVELTSWIGLGLVVVALLMLGGVLFTLRSGVVAALVLLAAGVLLFQHSGQDRQAGLPPEPLPPAAPPSPAAAAPAAPAPPLPPAPPRARRQRSRLGRLTLALAFLALGVLGFLDATAVLEPGAGDYTAATLAAVGGGLVVGAWWGRARGLIALGVVLIPVVAVTSLFPEGLRDARGTGEVYERPGSVEALPAEYELGAGKLVVDLRDIQLPGRQVHALRATIGAGQLMVLVPPTMNVVARGEAGVGSVELLSLRTSGVGPDLSAQQAGDPRQGTLDLDLRAGLGEIRLVRGGEGPPMAPFEFPHMRLFDQREVL